jgi:hypothetical protein
MGWHSSILYTDVENQANQANQRNRTTVSLEEYFRYCFHTHPTHIESNHLFLAGKLFQAYVCEAWAVAEQKRLAQLAAIQDNLRVELYQGLADAIVANVDANPTDLAKGPFSLHLSLVAHATCSSFARMPWPLTGILEVETFSSP